MGLAYNDLDDFKELEECNLKAIDLWQKINKELNPLVIYSYSALITANIELQDYDKAITYSNTALKIVDANKNVVSAEQIWNLYYNLGVCYVRLFDFTKAKIFLDKSESLYVNSGLNLNNDYINLLNSLAVTYSNLGLLAKANEYYEKGIAKALSTNSSLAYNLINSYSIVLANGGNIEKGEALLKIALKKSASVDGEESSGYFEVLNNYAEYLREYKGDFKKSIECYLQCIDFMSNNNQGLLLKTSVIFGYSLSLMEAGELEKALHTIQSLLISESKSTLLGFFKQNIKYSGLFIQNRMTKKYSSKPQIPQN
jgi:tetratricopeptide (TPR) repeat protein